MHSGDVIASIVVLLASVFVVHNVFLFFYFL